MDIGGIAYEVHISLNTYARIESLENTRLFTYLVVRDDAHVLFGFSAEDEKELFTHLISVSGIGPNTARVILSYMSVSEAVNAIIHDNVPAFKKVKGVGPKTAQRIILDLKDKLIKLELEQHDPMHLQPTDSSLREDAVTALQALGFQKAMISKQVDKALKDHPDLQQVEALIKTVLRQLS